MFRQALAIDEQLGRYDRVADTYLSIAKGKLSGDEHDLDHAEEMCRAALVINEKRERRWHVARSHGLLARVFRRRADLNLEHEEQSRRIVLDTCKQLAQEDLSGEHQLLGDCLERKKDLDGAEVMYCEALEIKQRLRRCGSFVNKRLGSIYWSRGDLDRAAAMYRTAFEVEAQEARAGELGLGFVADCCRLGLIYRALGEPDRAEAMYLRAFEIAENHSDQDSMAQACVGLGMTFRVRRKPARAEEAFRMALAIWEVIDKQDGVAEACADLGRICHDRGRIDDALQFWTRARDIYAQLGMNHDAQRLQTWLDDASPESNEQIAHD